MSEINDIDKKQPELDGLRKELETAKLRLMLAFADATEGFVKKFEPEFNGLVLKLFNLAIDEAQRNPGSGTHQGNPDINEVVAAMRKQQAQEGTGSVDGGDVVGGDWIDDLGRIIQALTSIVAEEKRFFLEIIKLIFCGC
ncbi:MAG: hypothetical protein AABP62_28540 [Planctomycetota bacterium]